MWRLSHCHSNTNFNPRSPHGERLLILSICTPPVVISIHAPRTGSDDLLATSVESLAIFQSTLPARGATRGRIFKRFPRKISIHAPRTGSDRTRRANITTFSDFNPRSPHGERLVHGDTARRQSDFNPRSPHGERHHCLLLMELLRRISIHAPRTGSDHWAAYNTAGRTYFNPRSPHGERHGAEHPAHRAE